MSDDDAQSKQEQILAVLDEAQKSHLDAIGLPRRPRGGPGMGGPVGSEPANPFTQETEAKALASLCERLTPK